MNRAFRFISTLLLSLVYPLLYLANQALISGVSALLVGRTSQGNSVELLERISNGDFLQIITIAACVLTSLVILILIVVRKSRGEHVLRIRPVSLPEFSVLFLLGISLNLATIYLINLLPIPEGMLRQYEEAVSKMAIGNRFWLSFLATAVFVPVTEELVFRGMTVHTLRRRFSIGVTLILQAIIFAGAHILPLQVLYVIPAALLLGMVYSWSGNFLTPVILHMVYNGFSITLNHLAPAAEEIPDPTPGEMMPVLVVSLILMGICLSILYAKRSQKRTREEDEVYEL